jgi:hypothetical protein
MATDDEYVESIPIPETETSSQQSQEPKNEESVSTNVEFVDNLNDEFLEKYKFNKTWAHILSCKLFYDKDWDGAFYYNYLWDEERQLNKVYYELVVLNEAFSKLMREGVTDSIDEMKELDDSCSELLIFYNRRDPRIPMPPSDFLSDFR